MNRDGEVGMEWKTVEGSVRGRGEEWSKSRRWEEGRSKRGGASKSRETDGILSAPFSLHLSHLQTRTCSIMQWFTHIFTLAHIDEQTRTISHTHTYTHTHIHTHIYTHTHTHTHTHTPHLHHILQDLCLCDLLFQSNDSSILRVWIIISWGLAHLLSMSEC